MESLIKLGLLAATGAATSRARHATRRAAIYLAGMVAVAILAAAGVFCALAALWVVLKPELGRLGAWLVLTAILLAAAAILALVLNHRRERHEPDDISSTLQSALGDLRAFTEQSGEGLRKAVEGREWQLVVAALLAGLFLGRRH